MLAELDRARRIIALSVIQIPSWRMGAVVSIKAIDKIVGYDIRATLENDYGADCAARRIVLLRLHGFIRHPISMCLATQYNFQLSDLLHCQPSAVDGRHRLPWAILDAKRDLQLRRSRGL